MPPIFIRSVIATILLAMSSIAIAADGPASATTTGSLKDKAMKIEILVGGQTLTATLRDNPAARDFASLLPLELSMGDLFAREKFGKLPRLLSEGPRVRSYEVGQIIYWSPGPDVAIFYRDDGQQIPGPGIVVLGDVEGPVDALASPGNVKVTITTAK